MASFTAKDHLPAAAPAQQVSDFASSSSSSSAAQQVEDKSRKKNTDCVYFLASPLTCKKGSECEYRHNEYARVNPRDCYYWLNGKCLNPKCSFRHPPLDTLLGTPGDSSAGGSSMPASSSATAGSSLAPSHAVPSAPYVAAKSTAPCIFFQQGYCLKGDRCPFSHGPNFDSNKAPEFPAANVSGFSRFNTAAGGLVKCSQIKIAPRANVSKPVESVPPQPKPSVHVVKAVPTNGVFAEKRGMPQPNVSNEGLPKQNETTSRSLNNGNSKSKSGIPSQAISWDDQRDQRLQSGKEADDLMRESSPGFDVLVDDELRDENYYGNDDQFPRIQGHEGRDRNEFEINLRDRYKSLDDVDPSIYHDRHGYDRYKPLQRHARDSSEKSVMEGSNYDRRGADKGVNPDGAMNSDLRQRLSKQRRTNGQNSVVKADYPPDNLAEEHRYRSSRRDSRHSPPRGSSIGSRLQGRIKLPGQPSSVHPPTSMHSEREYDKGRNHSRLSPTRPQSLRGRLQDRLKGKVQDDIGRDAASGRDVLDYNSSNFTAPKSLAELRKAKQPHSQSRELLKKSEEFTSVGKRRALESSQHSEDDISFEAPKPLSEILKRKRKAGDTEEVGKSTLNKENAAVEKQAENEEEENKLKEDAPLVPNKETNLPADVEESNPVPAEESKDQNLDFDNKMKPTGTEISQASNVSEAEEEALITEGVEGHEFEEEYYEEGEAVYEDEQEGGGQEGYNLEEGENGELPNEDYMEEDEEDNFAKKIGVMFS